MLLKQSTAVRPLLFLLVDSTDHISPKTGLSPTVTISKSGAAFASPAGAVAEVGNGFYKVAANATDSDTLGPLLLHATATGADPSDARFEVVAFDPSDAVRFGLTALPNAAAAASGGLPTGDASGRVLLQPTQTGVTIPTVTAVGTLTTYTGNTPQTGDAFARIGANGAGLTGVGLDAAQRVKLHGTQPDYAPLVPATAGRTLDVDTNHRAPVTLDAANVTGNIAADVQTVQGSDANAAGVGQMGGDYVTALLNVNVAAISDDAITAASVEADAVTKLQNGLSTLTAAQVWAVLTTGLTTAGSIGKRLADFVTTLVYEAPPSAAAIDTQLSNSHGSGAWGGGTGASADELLAAIRGNGTYLINPLIRDADHNPISGASVTIRQGGTTLFAGRTDSTGHVLYGDTYGFGLNAGSYTVLVSATGYAAISPQALTVSADAAPTYELATSPSVAAIPGTVAVDFDTISFVGRPISGAVVAYSLPSAPLLSGTSYIAPRVEHGTTGSNGRCRVFLIPGTYVVRCDDCSLEKTIVVGEGGGNVANL